MIRSAWLAARLTAAAIGLSIIVACLGAAWLVYGDRSLPRRPTTVDIYPGRNTDEIGEQLAQAGVVRSARWLTWYLRARRSPAAIEASEYSFEAHLSLRAVVDRLASGGRPLEARVTIPEGFTADQIAQRLADDRLVSAQEFVRYVRRASLVFGGARSDGLEGYLFPDTYLIPRVTRPAAIAALMTAQFRKELPKDYERAAKALKLTVPDIVIVASIIEREAKVDDERALMAGVYYNRLRRHMPLEVDATIEYALPAHKTELSYHDLAVESPYNTYTHFGLPPTPISNPGKRSLDAAFHPARTDYLYYVYKGGGRHQFSRTLAEQEAAERRYLR